MSLLSLFCSRARAIYPIDSLAACEAINSRADEQKFGIICDRDAVSGHPIFLSDIHHCFEQRAVSENASHSNWLVCLTVRTSIQDAPTD